MGRPLNKKYFGNRNIGTNGYEGVGNDDVSTVDVENAETSNKFPQGDDGIGGKQIRTVQLTNSGTYPGVLPYVDSSAPMPTLPGGVQAGNPVTYSKVISPGNIDSRGTGYRMGDTLTDENGVTYTVTALVTVSVTLTPGYGGTLYDNDNNIVFDSAGWSTPLSLDVTGNTGGVLTTFDVTSNGVWNDPDNAAPTHLQAVLSNTRDGADQNAFGAQFDIVWGVWGLEVLESPLFTDGQQNFQDGSVGTTVDNGPGQGAEITPVYTVDHVTFTQPGSGYIGTEDTSMQFSTSDQMTAEGFLVFAQDTGGAGSATNQENAIIAYIWQDEELRIADIVKQTGSKRYVCITNSNNTPGDGKEDETVYGYLVGYEAGAPKEMNINATDANGNTYYVTKLTAHKATLVQNSQNGSWLFADGARAEWTFNENPDNDQVTIENA